MTFDFTTPARSGEDTDHLPTEAHLREWAARYVPEESAQAWAEHVYTEWDEYEPDGTTSTETFLRGLMRTWRGEVGGYPPTPTS